MGQNIGTPMGALTPQLILLHCVKIWWDSLSVFTEKTNRQKNWHIQPIHLSIHWTDVHQIFRIGRQMGAADKSDICFASGQKRTMASD